jgi:hypothetical protein
MRFSTTPHQCSCGIDQQARSMDVCLLDQAGETLRHRHMPAPPEALRNASAPSRDQLVMAAECLFTWSWLADFARAET